MRLGYALFALGDNYLNSGKYKKTVTLMREAVKLFRRTGQETRYVLSLLTMARAYLRWDKPGRAMKYAEEALGKAGLSNLKTILPNCYLIIGSIQKELDDKKAASSFKKSIALWRELYPNDEEYGVESPLFEYGEYLVDRNPADAVKCLKEAYLLLMKRPPSAQGREFMKKILTLLVEMNVDLPMPETSRLARFEQSRKNLKRILDISRAINSQTQVKKVLEMVVDTALEISGAERGLIILLDNGKWEFSVQRNFYKGIMKNSDFPVIKSIVENVISEKIPFIARDIDRPDKLENISAGRSCSMKAVFSFPLVIKEKIVGCVYMDSRFVAVDTSRDLEDLLTTLMEQVTIIIDKTRIYEQVQKLSRKLEKKVERQGVELRITRSRFQKKQEELEERFHYGNIIAQSPNMREIIKLIHKVMKIDLPVYIYGESGTGKEVVAKAIHYSGERREGNFVAINCAAIPETLLESELFGFEKGAFTGANASKEGLFETANNGTILLDEIGDMSAAMQQKLLRVVQENEIRRVGGLESIKIDARIISASNRNLRELVSTGSFREDLFYRLNVISINLPPLKERTRDIPLLFEHFWQKYTGLPLAMPPDEKGNLLKMLTDYEWPGNIRELENEVYRLASLGSDTPDLKNLSRHVLEGRPPGESVETMFLTRENLTLPEIEKNCIVAALKMAKGNKAKAARILGIPRTSIKYKMDKFQIELEDIQYRSK
jgi:transcriptional regulator with GAF, ATPase, and Fis domain